MKSICVSILLVLIIIITFASQTCLAESTVEEMISDYHRLYQELQRANEIANHQKNYSKLEVEKAIQKRDFLDKRLLNLKNEIKAKGGKIKKKEKPDGEEQPDPGEENQTGAGEKQETDVQLTYRQKSAIKKEEYRIQVAHEKLERQDPNSKLAILYKRTIKRSQDRIRKIRDSARKTISVSPGSAIKAEQGANSVEAKLPKTHRPWILGDWPWDFQHPIREFKKLKVKYYRLQAEMRAVLLIKRDSWTYDQATDYNGKLSILCKLIIDTEEDLAFGLGNATKFERDLRQHEWKWENYLRKQSITDDAESKMNNTAAKFYKLLKKAGLRLGDQISKDDPNANQLAYLQSKHEEEQKDFLAKQIVSELAKYESGVVSDARKRRIEDGLALTRRKPPKLDIHRECGRSQSSFVYEMFLSKDEFQTFVNQGWDRLQATTR